MPTEISRTKKDSLVSIDSQHPLSPVFLLTLSLLAQLIDRKEWIREKIENPSEGQKEKILEKKRVVFLNKKEISDCYRGFFSLRSVQSKG